MKRKQKINPYDRGFTLIELVVGVAIAGILFAGALSTFTILARNVKAAREQTVLSSLASNYLEIVRNLPYSEVGTTNGNPSGSLPDLANAKTATIESNTYKIYYEVTYIDDPADGTILLSTDAAPNDYKQVKMTIVNNATSVSSKFLTNVSPKGLEGISNAGALFIKALDANGQPVPNANIHIENLSLTPDIVLDRQTDSAGNWIEVGLPNSVNGYHIVATKSGYSTDQTYPISAGNPNPIKPDSTVLNGQVTQVSLSIDSLSNLAIKTLDTACQNLNGVNVNVSGAKLIGTSPDVLKFNNNYSSSGGQVALNNIEWDTYTPVLLTGQSVMVYGTSPIQQITVLPGTSQTYTIILGPATANSLLVIVKDAATGTALENATVALRKNDATPVDYTGATGGSVWVQHDWSSGSGQAIFSDPKRYFNDDGNVDVTTAPVGIRLRSNSGVYVSSGTLESSTFDTGGASNYTTLVWDPPSQDPATTLRFQIASNKDNATWNYIGPDGTAATYYTVPGSSLSPAHNNNRYIRYKAFLSTTDNTKSPVVTSLALNYVSGCFTPGQVIFPGLAADNNYDIDVTLSGYQHFFASNLNISGNQVMEVLMSP